jgi:hypothetical protein
MTNIQMANHLFDLAVKVRWGILNSFAEQVANNRALSARQLEIVMKAEALLAERASQPQVNVPEGRTTVAIKVIKLKEQESFAPVAKRFHSTGWSPSFQSPVTMVTKVLGETAEGAKVWGNLP